MTASSLRIAKGTDYAAAVGELLRQLGRWAYAADPIGKVLAADMCYRYDKHTDWLELAHRLAAAGGFRLEQKPSGMWRLVDPSVVAVERRAAMELALMLGHVNVDDMLSMISAAEFTEWREFLAESSAGRYRMGMLEPTGSGAEFYKNVNVSVGGKSMQAIAEQVVGDAFRRLAELYKS